MQQENDIVATTEYTVDKLIKEKNWWDCLLLYFRYLKQRRLQNNVRTWSTDKFMMKAMWWWETRFRNAKNKLKSMWLINIVQLRDEKWRVHSIYVRVNFIIDEQKIRNNNTTYEIENIHNPHFPCSGEQDTNTLIQNRNTLIQKETTSKTSFDVVLSSFWLSMIEIEEWFKFSKSSKHIIDCLRFIKECSAKLDISPIYNKDTVNSTSILINKWYSIDEIAKIAKDDWRSDGCETYQEMIRNDYYLPAMY